MEEKIVVKVFFRETCNLFRAISLNLMPVELISILLQNHSLHQQCLSSFEPVLSCRFGLIHRLKEGRIAISYGMQIHS